MAKIILSMTNKVLSSLGGMFYSEERDDVATNMAKILSGKYED